MYMWFVVPAFWHAGLSHTSVPNDYKIVSHACEKMAAALKFVPSTLDVSIQKQSHQRKSRFRSL